MSIISAIIQGVVQGLTEFLPVSSSGHLTITQHILGQSGENLFFSVMLHIGTLLAVCVFYRKLIGRLVLEFGRMIRDIFTGKFKWSAMNHDRRMILMLVIGLLPLFLLFVPIPGTDMKIKDLADLFSQQRFFIVVGIALLGTSLLLFLGDRFSRRQKECSVTYGKTRFKVVGKTDLTVTDALIVGLVQCCAALFPGLSRSGSTLAAGQMRGLNKQTAFDYTFVIAIPSIIAAALLEIKDVVTADAPVGIELLPVLIGMAVAAVVGYLSIALFKWLLRSDRMIVFIIYTAVVGVAVIVISLIELNSGANLFTGAPLT